MLDVLCVGHLHSAAVVWTERKRNKHLQGRSSGPNPITAVWATSPPRTATDPQGLKQTVSTPHLPLHRVMVLLSQLELPGFNLPLRSRFPLYLWYRSLGPVGGSPSMARRLLPALAAPLLTVGLIHQLVQTAPRLALELAQCTPSQEALWQ